MITPAALTTEFANTAHSDDGASIRLANGNYVYLGGDTTWFAGKKTVSGYGYPHDNETILASGKLTPRSGPYGYGIQQIPNQGNAFFWMGGGVVYQGHMYVFTSRIVPSTANGNSPMAHVAFTPAIADEVIDNGTACGGAFCFRFTGAWLAQFDSSTLKFQKLINLQTMEGINGATYWHRAWYVFATSGSPKQGNVARVRLGGLTTPRAYRWHLGVIPATDDPGTVVSAIVYRGRVVAYTKRSDFMGNQLERLTAPTPLGPWKITALWPLNPPQAGEWTYSVQAHQGVGRRELISYAVGNCTTTDPMCYHIHFLLERR